MWDVEARLCNCMDLPHLIEDSLPALYVQDRLRSFTTDHPLHIDLAAGEKQMHEHVNEHRNTRSAA